MMVRMTMKLPLYTVSAWIGLAALGQAQSFTFSVDWRGPTIAQQASGSAFPITEADLLTFGPGAPGFGPLATPAFHLTGDVFGLQRYNICVGHPPSTPCGIDIDSVTQGMDTQLTNIPLPSGNRIWFSVDEFAVGTPGLTPAPTVLSEGGPIGDVCADIFVEYGLGIGPLPPSAGPGSHIGTFDGNGLPSTAPNAVTYPGIGLIEPNIPGSFPATGDNLDSLDIGATTGFPPFGYFFSLDSAFADPITGLANSGSAALHGFSGADILQVLAPGGTPLVYAPAALLGLDITASDIDDIDALVLAENGVPGFQASQMPYDWLTGGTDMVLFSVRRGSAVVGLIDSIFGVPIEPGDILTTPLIGGISGNPGILYAAETLGLATFRSGAVPHGDELDALDISPAPCFDCNHNGIEDAVDISTGGSADVNTNGIPDECEAIKEYCTCPASAAPCSNDDDGAGCENSSSSGAHLYFTGSQSVSADDLVLNVDGLPPNKNGLFYMGGASMQVPIADGLRCVGNGASGTFRYPVNNSGPTGVITRGPGIAAWACSHYAASGCLQAGSTWYFQLWYRDPPGPCGGGFNFSNGLRVDFGP